METETDLGEDAFNDIHAIDYLKNSRNCNLKHTFYGHKNHNYLHVPENDPEIDRAVGEVPIVEDGGTLQFSRIRLR